MIFLPTTERKTRRRRRTEWHLCARNSTLNKYSIFRMLMMPFTHSKLNNHWKKKRMFISFCDYYSSLLLCRCLSCCCGYYIIKIFLICFHRGMLARLPQNRITWKKICCGCRRRHRHLWARETKTSTEAQESQRPLTHTTSLSLSLSLRLIAHSSAHMTLLLERNERNATGYVVIWSSCSVVG